MGEPVFSVFVDNNLIYFDNIPKGDASWYLKNITSKYDWRAVVRGWDYEGHSLAYVMYFVTKIDARYLDSKMEDFPTKVPYSDNVFPAKPSIQFRSDKDKKVYNELKGMSKTSKKDDSLLEKLADLEHEQWMQWAKDLMKKEDLSQERVDRWEKECFKPYSELSEEMKEEDRKWARKILDITNEGKDMNKEASKTEWMNYKGWRIEVTPTKNNQWEFVAFQQDPFIERNGTAMKKHQAIEFAKRFVDYETDGRKKQAIKKTAVEPVNPLEGDSALSGIDDAGDEGLGGGDLGGGDLGGLGGGLDGGLGGGLDDVAEGMGNEYYDALRVTRTPDLENQIQHDDMDDLDYTKLT